MGDPEESHRSDNHRPSLEERFPRSEQLRQSNPVFNSNKLKLGVFGLNSIGGGFTLAPEAYRPSWQGSLAAAQVADRAGFEAIVPYARWKSIVPGKPDHRSSEVLECFAWAAAIAVETDYSAIFATCHVPVFPPVLACKQAATIDQISGGRFGLNIVAGWYSDELRMFGAEVLDHDGRYAQAREWTEIVQRLWSESVEVDHSGSFYEVKGAYLSPKPAQAPHPVVMNAGNSASGREFAAQFSDLTFVLLESEEADKIKEAVEGYRRLAREQFGREIQIWTAAYVVLEDTDVEAQSYVKHYAEDLGDYEAADAFIQGLISTSSTLPPEALHAIRQRILEGAGGSPLVGSAETIANRLKVFSDAGIDGVLMTWINYEEGIARFAEEVIPKLAGMGLRDQPDDAI